MSRDFFAGGKGKDPIGQLFIVLEEHPEGLQPFLPSRTDEVQALGKNGRGPVGHHGLAQGGGMGQLGLKVEVGVDQTGDGVQPLSVKGLLDLDLILIGGEGHDPSAVDQEGSAIHRLPVDVQDLYILDQQVGLFFPVDHIKDVVDLLKLRYSVSIHKIYLFSFIRI